MVPVHQRDRLLLALGLLASIYGFAIVIAFRLWEWWPAVISLLLVLGFTVRAGLRLLRR